jgi:hypothetical protein
MSVAEIRTRLGSNLQRVEGLAALSEWIEFPARSELLRASVVLLHATLEDVLRSILELRLPTANPEYLAMLKFAVGDRSKDHLSMSELANHRGKTVDELIVERIEAYLERSNFNNVQDVVHALERVGIATNLLEPYKDALAALMQRRHWIVHRADYFRNSEAPHALQLRPIPVAVVEGWRESVESVCAEILARMDSL